MTNKSLTSIWPSAAHITAAHMLSRQTGMSPQTALRYAYNEGARGPRKVSVHAMSSEYHMRGPF